MKRSFLIVTCLLSLLLWGCEKEQRIGPCYPYGIIEDVRTFSIDTWSDDWRYDWTHELNGEFLPDSPFDTIHRACWPIYLSGPVYSLTNEKDRYEQICLEWGVRIDNGEEPSRVLANVPFRGGMFVVCNHGITGMDLITESDFDAEHPANSSLADITDVTFASQESILTDNTYTIDDEVVCVRMNQINAATMQRIAPQITTRITRNPAQAGTYVFQQHIYCADGKVMKRRFKRAWAQEHPNK